MQFRATHDDQMRALRYKTCPTEAQVSSDEPVQLTRELIDEAIQRSKVKAAVTLSPFTAARRAHRAAQAAGGMKTFLRNAATFQNLPAFARRMRE